MRLAPALALSIAAVLSLGACQQQHDPIVPSPAPSATPVFASDEEALAAAEEAYRAYQTVEDAIGHDGGAGLERLNTVATDEALESTNSSFASFREAGYRSVGETHFTDLVLQQYAPNVAEGKGIVTAYVCLDVSDIDVLDKTETSVVSASRPPRQPFELAFDLSEGSSLILSSRTPWTGSGVCE
jgi:hypothetical protein